MTWSFVAPASSRSISSTIDSTAPIGENGDRHGRGSQSAVVVSEFEPERLTARGVVSVTLPELT
ncbi:MAG: hypothetical protein H0U18_01865 [Pyrinomonadaceae bacterium]|nr:hypothetical protein [Pyrinomonadaceae bacterium]